MLRPRLSLVLMGSSPLARGLRNEGGGRGIQSRIIPARAGFTTGQDWLHFYGKDHPRSRGVYRGDPSGVRGPTGSSPLARGLRACVLACMRVVGIIPARAGFTRRALRRIRTDRDHPRSRGVYTSRSRTLPRTAGSSPLARGLLGGRLPLVAVEGIIPARAGFTATACRRRAAAADHPRSRGVYHRPRRSPPVTGGSSPLARGLLGGGVKRDHAARIIPARAGFTRRLAASATASPDHPRSRGVYTRCS